MITPGGECQEGCPYIPKNPDEMIEMFSFSSLPEWPGNKLLELMVSKGTEGFSTGQIMRRNCIDSSSKSRKLLMQRA